MGVHPVRVEGAKCKVCCFVKVGDGGSELVLFDVCQRVPCVAGDVRVAQREPQSW